MYREALVVGINSYPFLKDDTGAKHLSKPAADAEAIARVLETYGNFRVKRLPEINIDGKWEVDPRLAHKKLVKMEDLQKAIENLFKPPSDAPATALLFFAGHGLRKEGDGESEGFLATSDANPQKEKWGLSLRWLRELLRESPVGQQIVWLDCCYSGELFNFSEADLEIVENRDRCFITATQAFELAYEQKGGEHGVLTGALLSGLSPETHTDGWVNNYRLHTFINNNKSAVSRQRIMSRTYGGEIILTAEKRKISGAVLRAEKCPYKGLESFDFKDEDAENFYGRTALTDTLLEKVRAGNFVAVVGASGSGKSSLVKAGLIYQLKLGQKLSGSDTWPILIFRPGDRPLDSLARAFAEVSGAEEAKEAKEAIAAGAVGLAKLVKEAAGSGRLVLVVDQFEECFTLCQDASERQKFFECLLGAMLAADDGADETDKLSVGDTNNPAVADKLVVVITMRGDFFGKCLEQEYAGLHRKIGKNLVTVTPMTSEELREAITKPAEQVGLRIDRELVKQIQEDVEGSPGVLPLLQYTLTQLWESRSLNVFTVAEYIKLGRVKGTLKKRADEVYESLNETQQQVAKRIFLKLTNLGEGTEDTRRQVFKSDLVTVLQDEALVNSVIEELAKNRLVVPSELLASGENSKKVPVVDVAHEALIRHWPKLREWVDENREAIRRERRIEDDVREWEAKNKSVDYLLRGLKLAEAEDFLEKYSDLVSLSSQTKDFIAASKTESDRLRKEEEARRERELEQERKARQAAETATRLAKEATLREKAARVKNLLPQEPLNALVLAIETTGSSLSSFQKVLPEVQSSLFDAIDARERNLLKGHQDYVYSVAFSPDGKTIVSGGDDGTVRLWDINGKAIGSPIKADEDSVSSVAFSPDGKTIVSGGDDSTVRLWDINGKAIGSPIKAHEGYVKSVAFSPDGKTIVSGGYDCTVRLWDIKGNAIGSPIKGHQGPVFSVAFSPDGKTIVSGGYDGTVRLWDINGKAIGVLKGHEGNVNSVAFSPDGKTIVSGGADGTVRLWDINGKAIGSPIKGHEGDVNSVAFSPDGKTIVSGGYDCTVRLWDINGKAIGSPIKGHEGYVNSVAFSPDGKTIVSGGTEGTVRLWDINGKAIGAPIKGHEGNVNSVAFSPDGKTIVSGGADGTVRLWDINGKAIGSPIKGHEGDVNSVAFSPDGKTIVSGGYDGTVRLWDINGKAIGSPIKGHEDDVSSVAFSPDGTTIVSCGDDRTVRLWDINGKEIGISIEGYDGSVSSVAFSPDSKTIVRGGYDGTVRLWDINGKAIGSPIKGHDGFVRSVAFSPDGKTIVSGGDDGTVRLWDIKGNAIGSPIKGHDGSVSSVAFSPDGKTIVSGGRDGTMRLWDINGKAIGVLKGHEGDVNSVAFSPDGKTIVSGGIDGTVRLWGGSWETWIDVACNRLREHPVLLKPETEEAKAAKETCQKYVWGKATNSNPGSLNPPF